MPISHKIPLSTLNSPTHVYGLGGTAGLEGALVFKETMTCPSVVSSVEFQFKVQTPSVSVGVAYHRVVSAPSSVCMQTPP